MARVSIVNWIIKKLKRCIAIVEDGDTASQAIASGKYVIWKGNACQASSAISQGETLSSSNLTAVSDGIGNELNSNIADVANTLNASKMRFSVVRNSAGFTFDCGDSDSATAFVFSGNQSICGYFDLGLGSSPTVTYRDLTGTTSGWTIAKSGTTITLTRTNGTMWGMACLIVALR